MHRRSLSRASVILIAFVVAVVALFPVTSVVAREHTANHGVNVADMDLSVDPGVDFYRYANGGWLDRTTIPPDFAGIETLSYLEGVTRLQLFQLLGDRATAADVQPGSDEWKAIRFFEQGTDLATRNAQGIGPIQPTLDEIEAIENLDELHRFLQTSIFQNVYGFFFVTAGPDMMDSNQTIAYLQGPVLGLPSRDYYLEDGPVTAATRDAYVDSSAQLLILIGRDAADAQAAAHAVYDFEVALAAPTLSREQAQDLSRIYNPTTLDELTASYPLLDWPDYLAELGLSHVAQLVVTETRYLNELDAIVREIPLAVIKDYLTLQLLWASSTILSEEVESAAFAFYGTALNGLEVQAPVEGRVLDQVSYLLGDALGKLYVEAYFSPEAKEESTALVQDVVSAFRHRLEHNPWMTDETKANALAKLAKLRIKVGYPDHWRDYEDVTIADSYFGSALSASSVLYRYSLDQIGKPVDANAWLFPPQTVNATYNPLRNEIIIPAGILQPPFFDAQADPASNFGAIGFVVGHEITHGFDLRGAQFDAQGNLANWWTGEDYERFQGLNDEVATQYSAIEILPERFIDGQMTVTENVADLGGIQVAYDALQTHLTTHGRPETDETQLTQEQRFFVAAATVWRAKARDEALLTQLAVDVHAPSTVRATQPLRNCDAFYEAFDIGPDDPMYLPPGDRIVIW